MSDLQRPNPPPPSFEVPDLELEPVSRSQRPASLPSGRQLSAVPAPSDGARLTGSDQAFGATFDFGDELSELEFERTAQPNLQIADEPRTAVATQSKAQALERSPSGVAATAANAAELAIDPRQLAILADYGDPPESAALTLAYAYRVFTRQRQLKRELLPIAAECERAQREREATLAEFSQAVRPALEQTDTFRRFLAPLVEIEQRSAARGQALTSINAQLGAEQASLDAELEQLKARLEAEQRLESDAKRRYDEREANAQRADAKLKRVQIEMRAVTHVAEQKIGPQGGQIPEQEAAQLQILEQRKEALGPGVARARAEFEQAKLALDSLHARLAALAQSERQISRKKQALGDAHRREVSARSQGVSDAEIDQRTALAELARAVLAAPGTVAISEAWLERVSKVSERAAALTARAEMYRRAITAYDVERARQGVRLACTAVGLLLLLFAFKLIF